jgi:hypothetical protein
MAARRSNVKKLLPICAALLLVIGVVHTSDAIPITLTYVTEFMEKDTNH